jgi:hypothetical protein
MKAAWNDKFIELNDKNISSYGKVLKKAKASPPF